MEYPLEQLADAFSFEESSHGKNIGPRYEAGYYKRYLANNEEFAPMIKEYGDKAVSSSYGQFQIMYPTAHQYGYRGTPEDLANPETNEKYFNIIIKDLIKKTNSLQDAASAYNAGMGGIGTNPKYVERIMKYLRRHYGEGTVIEEKVEDEGQ